MTKRLTKLIALALVFVMCLATLAACGPKPKPTATPNPGPVDQVTYKQGQYNTTTAVMPSNWNELTYKDNNDTQILGYIGSSFFDYDYKFEGGKYNADGSINADGIVDGAYTTNFSAATKLEDVTSTVDAKWGYTDDQKAEGGYAWKITLRNDLKWHDGTPITAADFEYSMQQTLDPKFMNHRANTYYDTLMIKNAKGYFFQDQAGVYNSVASYGYATNQEALDAGETLYIDVYEAWGAEGFLTLDGQKCPQWLAIDDETVYYLMGEDGTPALDEDGEYVDYVSGKGCWETYLGIGYGPHFDVGGQLANLVSIYEENMIRHVEWSDVGMYTIPEENAIVVCLDKAYSLLMDNGELSYQAAYYMSSLPLVKRDLYEACKIAPAEGATLWTSNYNSSLATTASWGPYMLTEFEAGSHFRLEKNLNWYGWNDEAYKNQYNITAIYTRKVEDPKTRWMGFLAGLYDDGALDTDNIEEYKDSKYVQYAPETGTYGMQLYSNLNVLKASDNNNGILAILEFRQAFNLAIDRTALVEAVWPGTTAPCFGLINPEYYYDIQNSPLLDDQGRYRESEIAKAGVLRAYGYTESEDGTWSINDLTGLTLEEAYETLTGYNPTLAKQRLEEAIEILMADPEYYGYDESEDITLIFGSSVDNDKQRFRCDYLQGVVDELCKGTALEGKIKLVFDASAGDQWAEAFRSGTTQIGFGYGFSGNPFNPFDIVGAFVNPDDNLNYHTYWDTSAIDLTMVMPEGNYNGAGETITMSIQNWYFCLNGLAESEGAAKTYNWGEGYAPVEVRLMILSALEEVTLQESRSIMLIAGIGGSLLGAKFSQLSDSYNTFMGFGGLRYMIVNYTEDEWNAYVTSMKGDLSAEYKKSE